MGNNTRVAEQAYQGGEGHHIKIMKACRLNAVQIQLGQAPGVSFCLPTTGRPNRPFSPFISPNPTEAYLMVFLPCAYPSGIGYCYKQ